jgi:hypothetical protein
MGQLSNCRNLPPALMEASGLRRSWPSNGDELLPQLGGALLLGEPEFADLKLLRDSRWKAISSANSLNIPIVSGSLIGPEKRSVGEHDWHRNIATRTWPACDGRNRPRRSRRRR